SSAWGKGRDVLEGRLAHYGLSAKLPEWHCPDVVLAGLQVCDSEASLVVGLSSRLKWSADGQDLPVPIAEARSTNTNRDTWHWLSEFVGDQAPDDAAMD